MPSIIQNRFEPRYFERSRMLRQQPMAGRIKTKQMDTVAGRMTHRQHFAGQPRLILRAIANLLPDNPGYSQPAKE
jgi:hypothetical protein